MKKDFAYAGVEARRRTRSHVQLSSEEAEDKGITSLPPSCLHKSRDALLGVVPILSVHDEIVLECAAQDAEVADQCFSIILRDAIEAVLGCPELTSHGVVVSLSKFAKTVKGGLEE